jgi:hypothetical protein
MRKWHRNGQLERDIECDGSGHVLSDLAWDESGQFKTSNLVALTVSDIR